MHQIEAYDQQIEWLLELDTPGVKYIVLRDLRDYPLDNPELSAARTDAHTKGPVASIPDEMADEGY